MSSLTFVLLSIFIKNNTIGTFFNSAFTLYFLLNKFSVLFFQIGLGAGATITGLGSADGLACAFFLLLKSN